MRAPASILCMLITAIALGQAKQDALYHLGEFWKAVSNSTSYKATVNVARIDSHTGKTVGTSQVRAYKKGRLFRSELEGQVALATNDLYVLVDGTNKLIVVQPRNGKAPDPVTDPLKTWSELLQKDSENLEQWKVESATDQSITLVAPSTGAAYDNLRVTLRAKDHLPLRIEYDVHGGEGMDFDHVRLDYIEMAVGCAIPAIVFDEGTIVHIEGNRITPAPAYKDHEVQYVTGS